MFRINTLLKIIKGIIIGKTKGISCSTPFVMSLIFKLDI